MSKNFEKCGVEHIVNFMAETGMNQSELSEAIGKSKGFLSQILAKGEAPKWTLLSIECLRRRIGKQRDDVTLVIKVPGTKKEAVKSFLDALGISTTAV